MHFPSMLLAPSQRGKGDKELVCVFSYKCACLLKVERGGGGWAEQTQADLFSDTISSSFVAAVRQMVPPGSSFNTHRHRHVHSHTCKYTHTLPACSVKDHTSFHYPSSVLYNNIRRGNNSMLSRTFHHGYQSVLLGSVARSPFFPVKLSLHSPPTPPPLSIKQHLMLWIKSESTSLRLVAPVGENGNKFCRGRPYCVPEENCHRSNVNKGNFNLKSLLLRPEV